MLFARTNWSSVYDRSKLMSAAAYRNFIIEIVRKLAGQQGFHVQPRRWVVV